MGRGGMFGVNWRRKSMGEGYVVKRNTTECYIDMLKNSMAAVKVSSAVRRVDAVMPRDEQGFSVNFHMTTMRSKLDKHPALVVTVQPHFTDTTQTRRHSALYPKEVYCVHNHGISLEMQPPTPRIMQSYPANSVPFPVLITHTPS